MTKEIQEQQEAPVKLVQQADRVVQVGLVQPEDQGQPEKQAQPVQLGQVEDLAQAEQVV